MCTQFSSSISELESRQPVGEDFCEPLIAVSRFLSDKSTSYEDSLRNNGARVLVCPNGRLPAECEGLMLPGGHDIDPALWAEERGARTGRPYAERDSEELDLLREALARDIPVLGICRGHQLMNVALGGSLHQHIETEAHKWTKGNGAHSHSFIAQL
jgi:hypothetical protein